MNLSVKAKLFTGFSIVLILLVSMAFILTRKLSETNDRLGDIVNVSSRKIILSQEILVNVMEAARQEKNIILENDPAEMKHYEDRIRAGLVTIDKKAVELSEILDDKGTKVLNKFMNTWKSYKINIDEIISLALKNQDEAAFKISIEKGFSVREEALTSLNLLVEKNEQGMAADKLKSDESYNSSITIIITLVIISLIISIAIAAWIIQGIGKRIGFISQEAEKIASREHTEVKMVDSGTDELSSIFNSLETVNQSFREITVSANSVASGNYEIDFRPRSGKDTLGNALKKMTTSLQETTAENVKHNWVTNGQNQLNESLRGDKNLEELSDSILAFLCRYLDARIGALYLFSEDNTLTLSGKYAFSAEEQLKEKFKVGEGLIGQAAAERKPLFLSDVKEDQIRIVSTVMNTKPKSIYIVPFMFEGNMLGVIEIGHLAEFSQMAREFMNSCMESIAVSVNSAISRKRIQLLLEETQVQSEELQSQQEELKQVNEELEEQAQNLKQQQEELQMTNEELEEQTQALE